MQLFIASGVCLCTDGLENKAVFGMNSVFFSSNPSLVNGSNTMFFSSWGVPQDKWNKQTLMHVFFTFIPTAHKYLFMQTPQLVMDCDNLQK